MPYVIVYLSDVKKLFIRVVSFLSCSNLFSLLGVCMGGIGGVCRCSASRRCCSASRRCCSSRRCSSSRRASSCCASRCRCAACFSSYCAACLL